MSVEVWSEWRANSKSVRHRFCFSTLFFLRSPCFSSTMSCVFRGRRWARAVSPSAGSAGTSRAAKSMQLKSSVAGAHSKTNKQGWFLDDTMQKQHGYSWKKKKKVWKSIFLVRRCSLCFNVLASRLCMGFGVKVFFPCINNNLVFVVLL